MNERKNLLGKQAMQKSFHFRSHFADFVRWEKKKSETRGFSSSSSSVFLISVTFTVNIMLKKIYDTRCNSRRQCSWKIFLFCCLCFRFFSFSLLFFVFQLRKKALREMLKWKHFRWNMKQRKKRKKRSASRVKSTNWILFLALSY